jgi:hypothetical protein
MGRFERAEHAMGGAAGRKIRAQEALRALRPEVQAARAEVDRLDGAAAGWERAYWRCAVDWLMGAWVTDLRSLVSIDEVSAWYGAFGHAVQEAVDAEVEIFAKTVRRLTESK